MENRLKNVMAAYLISRLICIMFVYLGHAQRVYLQQVPGGWEGVANWWLNPWTTYDSRLFLDIAANGYREITTPFYPLYPALLNLSGKTDVSSNRSSHFQCMLPVGSLGIL